jgi:hypothetical protein
MRNEHNSTRKGSEDKEKNERTVNSYRIFKSQKVLIFNKNKLKSVK